MKTFEVAHKLKDSSVSVLKYTNTKLHSGMVFEMTGDEKLKGLYVVTGQKKVDCKDCPLSVPLRYTPNFSTCGLLRVSRRGRAHKFCTKDLRGSAYGDNAFTIKKLDTIMEGL